MALAKPNASKSIPLGRKFEDFIDSTVDPALYQRRHIKFGFGLFNFIESGPGCRVLRHKKLATVLIRYRRNFERADAVRLVDDFLFVHAD